MIATARPRVQRFFELQDFAATSTVIFFRQIAVRDRGGDFGDVSHLTVSCWP